MPRKLTFVYKNSRFEATLNKIDRSQLYGSVRVLTRSAEDEPCTLATLAIDGKTLIPRGGTAMGYINSEGEWITRNELKPVNLNGKPLVEVPSSFDEPIVLKNTVRPEILLDHNVRLTYSLEPDSNFPAPFLKALKQGKLFQFGFSYRGGVDYDPAYVLADEHAQVWMLVATPNDIQYIKLEQAALCGTYNDDDSEDSEDEDALDFGML